MVYFVENETCGFIKIGKAVDVRRRLSQLQCASCHKLALIGTVQGDESEEKDWHARFASIRSHGEWFQATESLKAAIHFYGHDPQSSVYRLFPVLLTANRQEEEPHRLKRLQRVLHLGVYRTYCRFGPIESQHLVSELHQLHDHKGELSVMWRSECDPSLRKLLDNIWKHDECEDDASHHTVPRMIDFFV